MVTNSSYYLDDETRDLRDDALYVYLDLCYDIYRDKEMKQVAKLQSHISRGNCDYDTVLEIREQICDIYYDVETTSYLDIMKLYPRVKL